MRDWARHCNLPGEDGEYYSYHAEVEGAEASVMPLGRERTLRLTHTL